MKFVLKKLATLLITLLILSFLAYAAFEMVGDPVGMISGINLVYLPCDAAVTDALRAAARACGARVFEGAVATGDRFVEDIAEKRRLHAFFGADACDMEGAAIAQAAYELGVPFAMYRCVSDTLKGNGQEYALNAGRAAEVSRAVLRRWLEGSCGD